MAKCAMCNHNQGDCKLKIRQRGERDWTTGCRPDECCSNYRPNNEILEDYPDDRCCGTCLNYRAYCCIYENVTDTDHSLCQSYNKVHPDWD